MKYDKLKDPALIAPKAEAKYAVSGAAVVAFGGCHYIAATDGCALSMVLAHLEDGDDADGAKAYPVAAFAAAARAAKRSPHARIALSGAATVPSDAGAASFPALDVRFPSVASVVPTGAPVQRLHINAALLAKLARALGVEAVTLEFSKLDGGTDCLTCSPIVVRATFGGGRGEPDVDGSFGVIMPITSDVQRKKAKGRR